jgi:hypothetical protein
VLRSIWGCLALTRDNQQKFNRPEHSFRRSVLGIEVAMHNDLEIKEPEIMPPAPQKEPERIVPEIPPDKDAPEKNTPTRGAN